MTPRMMLTIGVVLVFISGLIGGYTTAHATIPQKIVVEEWNGDQFVSSQPFPIDSMNTIGLRTNTWYVNTTGITRYDIRFV